MISLEFIAAYTEALPNLQAVGWIWFKTPTSPVRISFKLEHPQEAKKQSMMKI